MLYKDVPVTIPKKKLTVLFDSIFDDILGKKSVGTVNLVFTDDAKMKSLNKQFRQKNKTTDVLSFRIDNTESEDDVFGEIYISVKVATKQAAGYDAPLSEELMRLACHGLLHILGYDHIKIKDAVKMKAAEDYYLNQV